MAISPRSFFNNDTAMILASNAQRDRADAKLSANFQILGSSIIRLTSELGNFSKFIITGQQQENKILDSYVAEVQAKKQLPALSGEGTTSAARSIVGASTMGETPPSILGARAGAGGLAAMIAGIIASVGTDTPGSSSGGGDGDGGGGGNYGSAGEEAVKNFAATQGYSPEMTAGLLSTIKAESGFNPYAVGDSGNSYGLFQFNRAGGDRRTPFLNFLEKSGVKDPQKLFTDENNPNREKYKDKVFNLTLEYMMKKEEGAQIARDYSKSKDLRTIMGGFEDIERYKGDQSRLPRNKRNNPKYNDRLEDAQQYLKSGVAGKPIAATVTSPTSGTPTSVSPTQQSPMVRTGKAEDTTQPAKNIKPSTSSQVASAITPTTESSAPMIAMVPSGGEQPSQQSLAPATNSVTASGSPKSNHWLSDIARLNMGIAVMGA